MEKTAASPYWTGMTLFTVGSRGAGRRHLMQDVMYKSPGRVAFKGQVFSAPMDVRECECSLSLSAYCMGGPGTTASCAGIEVTVGVSLISAAVR